MSRLLMIDNEPGIRKLVSHTLPKPFAVAELVARVRARLRQPAPRPATASCMPAA